MKKNPNEKGITIILTLVILTNILMIALVVGVFSLNQQKITTNTRNSAYAIFAATSGLEKAFYDIRVKVPDNCASLNPGPVTAALTNESSYSVSANPCNQFSSSVTSYGTYRGITRTIEANW